MTLLETKHWLVELNNEWEQLFGKYNWYTCTLFHCYFEKDVITYGYEFELTLLGLGIRIRYNTDKSNEQFEKWAKESREETLQAWNEAEIKEMVKKTMSSK